MEITTFSEMRANMKAYFDKACDNHEPVYVKRKDGRDVVILSKEDYESMDETAYLMASPANAKHLTDAIARLESSNPEDRVVFDTIEDFEDYVKSRGIDLNGDGEEDEDY